jgi:predicted regulator of Ras-like GTPase activity (Roadblock/LC7/MglB family)
MAALAAGSFAANEAIAGLVGESNFASIYQQGEHFSLLVGNVGSNVLLIVIFKAALSVGVIKYYAATTIHRIAAQLLKAQERTPNETVDLVSLDLEDTSEFFKKKA